MSRRIRLSKPSRPSGLPQQQSRNTVDDEEDTDSVVIEDLPDKELLEKLRRNVRSHDEVECTFASAINSIEQK